MYPQQHYKVNIYYGDSLYGTHHFRRALVKSSINLSLAKINI